MKVEILGTDSSFDMTEGTSPAIGDIQLLLTGIMFVEIGEGVSKAVSIGTTSMGIKTSELLSMLVSKEKVEDET